MNTVTNNNTIDITSPKLFESGAFKKAMMQQIKEAGGAKAVLQQKDLIKSLTKSALEALLEIEMEEHVGYSKYSTEGYNTGNSRNGQTNKTVRGDFGEIQINTPRDRNGTFEPQVVKKRESNLGNFSDKIISLYARGMTTREIQEHLEQMYEIEVSPEFISRATERIQEEVIEWQSRPLEAIYPVVYVDGLRVSIRSDNNKGPVLKKCVYVVLGIDIKGRQEVLGIWIQPTEGSHFWLSVLTELKSRGVKDIIVACMDGLTGLPEAFEAAFPKTDVQLCVVHQVRNSIKFVCHKDRRTFCQDMRLIYTASTIEEAELQFSKFTEKWGKRYPAAIQSWKQNWNLLTAFFQYPVELRTFIYTTNSIESLNAQLRKNIANRKVFPSDDSVRKILVFNIKKFTNKWTKRKSWNIIIQQLSLIFPDRIAGHINDNE